MACGAGHFTLKELDTIKDRYKHSLDYVVSDKSLQVTLQPSVSLWKAVSWGWHEFECVPAPVHAGCHIRSTRRPRNYPERRSISRQHTGPAQSRLQSATW